jgi:hypothetical protein
MIGVASRRSHNRRSIATVRHRSTVIAIPMLPMRSNVEPVCGSAASNPHVSGPPSPPPTGMSKDPDPDPDAMPGSFMAPESFMAGIPGMIC